MLASTLFKAYGPASSSLLKSPVVLQRVKAHGKGTIFTSGRGPRRHCLGLLRTRGRELRIRMPIVPRRSSVLIPSGYRDHLSATTRSRSGNCRAWMAAGTSGFRSQRRYDLVEILADATVDTLYRTVRGRKIDAHEIGGLARPGASAIPMIATYSRRTTLNDSIPRPTPDRPAFSAGIPGIDNGHPQRRLCPVAS